MKLRFDRQKPRHTLLSICYRLAKLPFASANRKMRFYLDLMITFGADFAMDRDDYGKCMGAAAEAGYGGPLTLIFESPGDEWRGLELERDFVRGFFGGAKAA